MSGTHGGAVDRLLVGWYGPYTCTLQQLVCEIQVPVWMRIVCGVGHLQVRSELALSQALDSRGLMRVIDAPLSFGSSQEREVEKREGF